MAQPHTLTKQNPYEIMDVFPVIFPVHPWPRQPDGKTPWFSADPRHHDQKPEIFPGHDVILRHRDGHDLGVRCQADQIGGWMWRHTDLYHIWFRFKSEAGLKPFWEDSTIPASRVPGDTEGKAWVLTVAFILQSEKSHHASSSVFFVGHTASILLQDISTVSQTQRKPFGLCTLIAPR